MAFKENLASLPEAEGCKLSLFDELGGMVAVIDNAPGTAGSFRVYAWLANKFEVINQEAAKLGLEVFAEHSDDARLNPGKHPNIDRLLSLQESKKFLLVKLE